ncbi:hypothetical protein COCSUDRAFT_34466 [Coccomyxa subellipsoidea C-169]|uniref:Uncharacterized protein n=1 Tax=Coccomyxa subellipsoidea (strain C-169) TaxID=574566 RepID=I0YJY6_COCSC|nr:hypothetical protein COCSUDRAFT_34466 [Coccomyxa subellipsoidea C-169]EIE18705.1 hypothetical protein COCSUDRAFT_34466 [Coccomyxa subellipsoidea C-169]|eukprot:XP_005643249.1 hypothetical protein COCSUDRAFT_34466 [Coccomyxa subellipsoidea C-169]
MARPACVGKPLYTGRASAELHSLLGALRATRGCTPVLHNTNFYLRRSEFERRIMLVPKEGARVGASEAQNFVIPQG